MSATSENHTNSQPTSTRANLLPTLATLSLAASVGLLLAVLLFYNQSQNTPAPAAAPASAVRSVLHWQATDFTLPALSGGEIRLSDYRGRVVFLNFWETWCAPCRLEMPDFAAFLAEQGDDTTAAILTVNGGQSAERIHEFYDELGIAPLPTLLDTNGRVTALYGVLQLPQTFVLDTDGVARARVLGAMNLEEMRAQYAAVSGASGVSDSSAGKPRSAASGTEEAPPAEIVMSELQDSISSTIEALASDINWQAIDFTLSELDGDEIRLSDYHGRVIFLNFWQTWCVPCRDEMPAFADFLAEQEPDSGAILLTVNGIGVGGGESEAKIRKFYDELGMAPLPTLLDKRGRVARLYNIYILPQTLIIDVDGVVRERLFGELSLAQLRAHFRNTQRAQDEPS